MAATPPVESTASSVYSARTPACAGPASPVIARAASPPLAASVSGGREVKEEKGSYNAYNAEKGEAYKKDWR